MAGGGDSALEEALFLTRFASKVTVIHRRDELRASKIMQERAFKNPKIEFLWDSVIVDVLGDTKVSGVKIKHTKSAETFDLPVTGPLRRHRPRAQQRARSRASSTWRTTATCAPSAESSRTSVEGVFACGDVQDHIYRQAVTSAGSGCMAAIDAEHWLEERGE